MKICIKICTICLLLVSCKLNLDKAEGGNSSAPLYSSTKNDIYLSIQSDNREYIIGETARITATLENNSTSELQIYLPAMDYPPIQVYIDTKFNGYKLLVHPDEPLSYGATIDRKIILPGEIYARDILWDLSIGENLFAPNGKYNVTAEIVLSDDDNNVVDRHKISQELLIKSDLTYMLPIEVITITHSNQIIKNWYQQNNYQDKCMLEINGIYKLVEFREGEATYSNEIISDLIDLSSDVPSCELKLLDGPYWRVTYTSMSHEFPFYYFQINAINGNILEESHY